MSTAVDGGSTPVRRGRGAGRSSWVADLVVVATWFVVLGLLAGVLWWALTPLPEATRVGNAASLDPEQLTGEVAADGWFAIIATVSGLLSGIVLLAWRRRDPLLMVVLTVVGAGLASLLVLVVGRLLGPGDVVTALRALPEGGKAAVPLKVHAQGVTLLLPAAAALGALVQLWVLRREDDPDRRADDGSGAADVGDHGVEHPDQVARR